MINLTKRQQEILNFIRQNPEATNQQIKQYLEANFEKTSRITIIRDVDILLTAHLIQKIGQGRTTVYSEKVDNLALKFIDVEEYFQKETDKRSLLNDRFNWEIFSYLKDIFSQKELSNLNQLNLGYQNRIKKLTPTIIKKEYERLTIELSWKSSQIEGNTYSLIDTEILIKEQKEAKGHKKEEAIMILNHKKALDYIWQKDDYFQKLTLKKIENIHSLIITDLAVNRGLRRKPVGIVGTKFKPLDNYFQIKEAMEKTIKIINQAKDPFIKTLIAILMISYIQPFEDGNKRTSRLVGDAILLAYNICPLSYRNINEVDYKKAMILFYEQNNLRLFKELFIGQFKFAVENYFI